RSSRCDAALIGRTLQPRARWSGVFALCEGDFTMVVVMAGDATDADVEGVVAKVEAAGGSAFVSRGIERTIVGLVGDIEQFYALNLRALPGVSDVVDLGAV